jgi:hypothetical protein
MQKYVLKYVLAPLAAVMVLALIIQLSDSHLDIWGNFWTSLGNILRPFGQFIVDVYKALTGDRSALH